MNSGELYYMRKNNNLNAKTEYINCILPREPTPTVRVYHEEGCSTWITMHG